MKLKYIKDPDLNLIADLQKGWNIRDTGVKIRLENTSGFSRFEYDSLEDFNREWATLKEPLLQGKLRESLKLWAEYHGVNKVRYRRKTKYSLFYFYDKNLKFDIEFKINTRIYNLEDDTEYNIIDLVGE